MACVGACPESAVDGNGGGPATPPSSSERKLRAVAAQCEETWRGAGDFRSLRACFLTPSLGAREARLLNEPPPYPIAFLLRQGLRTKQMVRRSCWEGWRAIRCFSQPRRCAACRCAPISRVVDMMSSRTRGVSIPFSLGDRELDRPPSAPVFSIHPGHCLTPRTRPAGGFLRALLGRLFFSGLRPGAAAFPRASRRSRKAARDQALAKAGDELVAGPPR
jgi:hypothetical protein